MKIGLIGFGYRGLMFYRSVQEMRRTGLRIVAIASPDLDRRKERTSRVVAPMGTVLHTPSWNELAGIAISISVEELLTNSDVELVVITGQGSDCADIVRRAISMGKHVLVECPFSANADEAAELVEQARRRRVRGKSLRLFVAQYPLFHGPIYDLVNNGLATQTSKYGLIKSIGVRRIIQTNSAAAKNRDHWQSRVQAQIADMSLLQMALTPQSHLLTCRKDTRDSQNLQSLIFSGPKASRRMLREFECGPDVALAEYLRIDAQFENAVFTLEISRPHIPGDYQRQNSPAQLHTRSGKTKATWTWEDWEVNPCLRLLDLVCKSMKGAKVPEILSPSLASNALRFCEEEVSSPNGSAPRLLSWNLGKGKCQFIEQQNRIFTPLRLTYQLDKAENGGESGGRNRA